MDWTIVAAIVVGIPLAFLAMALGGALVFGIAGPILARRMGGLPKCPCSSMLAGGSVPDTEPQESA